MVFDIYYLRRAYPLARAAIDDDGLSDAFYAQATDMVFAVGPDGVVCSFSYAEQRAFRWDPGMGEWVPMGVAWPTEREDAAPAG